MNFFDADENPQEAAQYEKKREAERKLAAAKLGIRKTLREKGVPAYGRGAIVAIIVLSITTLAFAILSYVLYDSNITYEARNAAAYNKAYYQLIMDSNNLETTLSKAVASDTKEYRGIILAEASAHALSASNNLAVIPSEVEDDKEKVFKFFNQTMDYTKYLAKKVNGGERLSEEEESNLKKLLATSAELKDTLNAAYDAYGGSGKLFTSGVILSSDVLNPMDISYGDLSEASIEYPTLIYDGPFSDVKEEAEGELEDGKDIGIEEAKRIACELFDVTEVKSLYEDEQNDLAYSFTAGDAMIQIAKKNGDLVMYSRYKDVGESVLSKEEGESAAESFLEKIGYNDLAPVWRSSVNGVLTINFAYKTEDVVCYSRLVKVSVALDNGDILGLEGTTYVAKRGEEVEKEFDIKMDEAEKIVSRKLSIKSSRKAIIPKNGKEIATYEFFGEIDGMQFYVYVNAKTGAEAEVLRVVESSEQGENVI